METMSQQRDHVENIVHQGMNRDGIFEEKTAWMSDDDVEVDPNTDNNKNDKSDYESGDKIPPKPSYSFYDYVRAELTRGYYLEQDAARYAEKRKKVYTFMLIPRKMEKFMLFGFFQCADAFLYLFTFLPLRVFHAVIRMFTHPCGFSQGSSVLEAAQLCDVLKGIILAACCALITYVDTSMLYHIIRGQAIIKLYIFFNMLEIADRLFASFGQDILDSLFWTAAEPRDRKREHIGLVPHLLLAVTYVFLHACLVLFQATTLNVAFNSHNKALLTIMMSNNFVEIKGAVFKRFAKNNLFQMSCSDVRERFHYLILLGIVIIRNMTEFDWNMDHLWSLIPDMIMVLLAECIVDWLKHAFIVKFNNIPSDVSVAMCVHMAATVYEEYTVSLAYDTAISRQKNAFSDHSDLVSRRMGFTPLPLACLLFRVLNQSLKLRGYLGLLLLLLGYICLVTLKILNSIFLLGFTCDYITEYREKRRQKMEAERQRQEEMALRRHSVDNSSKIQRPTPPKRCLSEATIPLLETLRASPPANSRESTPQDSPRKTAVTPRTRRISEKSDFTDDKPPLSDIDRYSMCSNRIV